MNRTNQPSTRDG